MKFKDKINQFFFLDEEDDELLEEQEQATNVPNKKQNPASVSQSPRIQNFVKRAPSSPNVRSSVKSETNVVPLNQHPSQNPKIKIVEPRTYSEVRGIADLVLKNYSVILNFRRIEKEQAKKILDFLMGTVYAVDGDIQRIGEEIFVCTPSNVDIDGTELETLSSTEFY